MVVIQPFYKNLGSFYNSMDGISLKMAETSILMVGNVQSAKGTVGLRECCRHLEKGRRGEAKARTGAGTAKTCGAALRATLVPV